MSVATFQPETDAYLTSFLPNLNNGTNTFLAAGYDGASEVRRSVLKFNISSLPENAVINSATLRVWVVAQFGGDMTFRFHKLTTDYSEGSVTWNSPWASPGGDYSGSLYTEDTFFAGTSLFRLFDVKSLVEDAFENESGILRLLWKSADEGSANYREIASSENATSNFRPLLTIEYGVPNTRLPRLCRMYIGDVKQLTAPTVRVGPFLNQADAKTRMTAAGLTLGSITCRVVRADNTTATITLSGSNFVEIGSGWFHLTLTGSHTSTIGTLEIAFDAPSQIVPVDNTFRVLSAEVYDWLYGSNLRLDDIESAISNMQGSGFVTSTDSLEALRDVFDETVAPNVVGAGVSGSGFLSDSVSMIRQLVDEPSVNAKYTDADLLNYWRGSMATVMADINANTDHPIVARIALAITVGKQVYALPPQCQKVYYIASFDSNTGQKQWEIMPGSLWDFSHYGFRIEGSTLRFLSKPISAETLEIGFVPNAEPHPHKGTSATYTTTTFTLAETPADGTLDTRPQAYAGYILRVTGSTDSAAVYVQDRIITSYNNQTRVATVSEAFSPALVGTITYEVIPIYSELLKQIWATHAAMTILAVEGASKKYQLMSAVHQQRLRALRLSLQKEFRMGSSFEGRTATNDLNRYGFGVVGRP